MTACRTARGQIVRIADDRELRPRLAAHVAGCLGCQAEAARQRAVQRGLRALRTEMVDAPADLVAKVMARLAGGGAAPRRRRPLEWAAAGSAVVALVGAAALVGRRMRGIGAGA